MSSWFGVAIPIKVSHCACNVITKRQDHWSHRSRLLGLHLLWRRLTEHYILLSAAIVVEANVADYSAWLRGMRVQINRVGVSVGMKLAAMWVTERTSKRKA